MNKTASDPAMFEEYEGDRQFAITLARGLEILRCFTVDRPILSNRELSQLTGLAKPTITRFTYTLTRIGYLQTDARSGKFQLGSAVLSLGYPLLANLGVRQLARPLMRELAEGVGGSVSLGVRDRLNMVYVETSRHHSVLNSRLSDVGLTYPLVATAIGRAYLCGCAPGERQALLNEIRVKTPDQWEHHGAAVLRNIEEFPKRGFCSAHGDLQSDVYSVGVPLRRQSNGLLIAVNCVVHSFQTSTSDLEQNIGPRLAALGRALDQSLALL
ncbi:IclR family transcriptional regulator [Bordetella bronchiseptica]|uniref:IclR family transcriptional regulator n=2 Tax=Bordetella bronchiseptica TaxID=518 RepID=UPI001F44560B|nr:IclR family transcriptional regulator [Bordetella bronchiseptica]